MTRAVNKHGRPLDRDWRHACVWIVGPSVSALMVYGMARLGWLYFFG